MLVGTLDCKDPTTKCHWEKIMLEIPTFSYFLTSGALDFAVLVLNYFPIQKELCSAFCSCKKSTCTCILYTCTLCIPLCIYENQLHNSSPLIWTLIHIENLNGVDDPVDVAAEFGILPGCCGMHTWHLSRRQCPCAVAQVSKLDFASLGSRRSGQQFLGIAGS